jgi:hypothetical protein
VSVTQWLAPTDAPEPGKGQWRQGITVLIKGSRPGVGRFSLDRRALRVTERRLGQNRKQADNPKPQAAVLRHGASLPWQKTVADRRSTGDSRVDGEKQNVKE